jgi:CheY-like chemotaxis protein
MASALTGPGPAEPLPEEALEVVFIGKDRGLAELYRLRLELDGYWVTLSPTIETGLQNFRHHLPDLIFLDMGNENGIKTSALQELRRNVAWRGIPVILLWRGDSEVVEGADVQLGEQDFIVRVDTVPTEEFWTDQTDYLASPARPLLGGASDQGATPARRSRRPAPSPRPSASR